MENKKFGRREFLKITIATAAAAGLSHFRILNVGGTDVALAQDNCQYVPPSTDVCDPSGTGGPPDPDTCPEPPYTGDSDLCTVQGDPDVCIPQIGEADACPDPGLVTGGDVCMPEFNEPDICESGAPDDCGAGGPDTCNPPSDPDDPNAVGVETFDAADGVEAASATLPVLGGVIAALGAAALWVRSRLRRDE